MIVVLRTFLKSMKISGITLFPFIILQRKEDCKNRVLINHERIHLRQQLELLILPFYFLYVTEYILRLIYLRNRYQAYRSISFEKEAYENETDFNYLRNKGFWSFLNYLK